MRQLGLSYTADGRANQEQDVVKDKSRGRFETTFLKNFSWDWRMGSWSDQVTPGRENTLYKDLNRKRTWCVWGPEGHAAWPRQEQGAQDQSSTGLRLKGQQETHVPSGHPKDSDFYPEPSEVIEGFKQRNNVLRFAFFQGSLSLNTRKWVECMCGYEWIQENHLAFCNNAGNQ